MLYPTEVQIEPEELEAQPPEFVADVGAQSDATREPLSTSAVRDCDSISARYGRNLPEADSEDFDISSANAYKPSSMAVSFLVQLPMGAEIVVTASGGRYVRKAVMLLGNERDWWLRSPVRLVSRFLRGDFPSSNPSYVQAHDPVLENVENLDVRIELFARPSDSVPHGFLVTVCLINRQQAEGRLDSQSLFQCHFRAEVVHGESSEMIHPYPTGKPLDKDERSLELLYRDKRTFAVGHGCAADWVMAASPDFARSVSAECLPAFEASRTTPDIFDSAGRPLEASMRSLSGIVEEMDGFDDLEAIVAEYERWIEKQEARIPLLGEYLRVTAREHMQECSRSASRMRRGLSLLRSDSQIRRAFELANKAMLIQQMRSRREARAASFDHQSSRLYFARPYASLDVNSEDAHRCKWRAFQIGFILASLVSTADPDDVDRDCVELIWFPTGGGKTEAYLGLASMSIFLRRLRNKADTGVHALMRYTLRLLTAQQFQRASRLICAMEFVRRENVTELGSDEFSLGIWLGEASTPNTRDEARAVLRSLSKADGAKQNQFVVDRCPWCGAQMGPVELSDGHRKKKEIPRVIGYVQRGSTVAYSCPDGQCEFHEALPLYVIDEDIYEKRPALVIGTVDKFARLAWRPEARALFGIDDEGVRTYSPPGLIIQDELHLISGPLGSMVGLYEPVIEELCTDRRKPRPAKPKIVSSTATIRSYAEQIFGLYARGAARLFPPPGLDANDSFFATAAYTRDGKLERDRIFVGVHAPGLGSLQTAEVRTFAALLQAPVPLSTESRDPWWTLLLFFNSLRELGTTLTLFQSDIPDLLKGALRQRLGLRFQNVRKIRKLLELTGRLSGDEVPRAISALEVPTDSQQSNAVDVCLASNIIEVGVDIDRLSLMAVVGQPKTTSQYIQVTGRVGRKAC